MKDAIISEELLVRYLLGRMSEEERDRVDEQYFGDRDFLEQLLTVEDDLIDSYVRGELPPSDRRQFEEFFLRSPERHRRVALARRWMNIVARSSATGKKAEVASRTSWREKFRFNSRWFMVPVAVSFLLAATILWLGFYISRLNSQIKDLRADISARETAKQEIERQLSDERNLNNQLRDELAEANSRTPVEPSAPKVVALLLNPGLPRSGGETTRLVIPSDTRMVRLQAKFKAGEYPGYSAMIETAEGRRVWSRKGLKARSAGDSKTVTMNVAAATFAEQDYVLTVSGLRPTGEAEAVGEYYFRVAKK